MSSQATAVEARVTQAANRARLLVVVGALVSFLFSVSLWFGGARDEGLFVGLWVPSILALGCLLLPARR